MGESYRMSWSAGLGSTGVWESWAVTGG